MGESLDSRDETAIRRLLALYAHLLDDGRYQEWSELFAEDAEFAVWGSIHKGRETIRDAIAGMFRDAGGEPGQHTILTPVLQKTGLASALAWTDFLFVGRSDNSFSVLTAGRYYDELVSDGSRWRFQRREVRPVGEPAPAGLPEPPAS